MSVELTYDQAQDLLPAYVLVTLQVIEEAAALLSYLAPPAPLPADTKAL